jgi:probable F420-dependent oxidoreductase
MSIPVNQRLGRIGVWSLDLRFGDRGAASEAAAELDELGYGAIWVPGGIGGDIQGDVDHLLAATRRTTIATGIINVWKHTPAEIAGWWKGLPADRQARVMMGLGISHSPLIGESYKKPLGVMREYLEAMQAEGVPAEAMCVAALRPRMLELARDLTAGSHPYLVGTGHSALARAILGPGKLLAPEQGVILETDRAKVREVANEALTHYRNLPNYVASWKYQGYSDEDIAQVSDRLIDGIFAWGTVDQVAARVREHLDAGADHVCMQVLGVQGLPRQAWRDLAAALI